MIVCKKYEWDMGHRLPFHDGKCFRLHGHRYVAEIDIEGFIQAQWQHNPAAGMERNPEAGMVIDFYKVKEALDKTLGFWDHRTMLWEQDAFHVSCHDTSTHAEPHECDEVAGVFRVPFIPTAENISIEAMRLLREEGLNVVRVRIYETPSGWAEHYHAE